MSDKYKKSRKKRRAQKKEKADRNTDQAGAFDLNVPPDENATPKRRQRAPEKPKDVQNTEKSQIKFVMPIIEVVGKKPRNEQEDSKPIFFFYIRYEKNLFMLLYL